MNGFHIREYRAEDFQEVFSLWEETGMTGTARGDDPASVDRTLVNGGRLFVMVYQPEGIIAGTSWLTHDGRRTYLHHFGILPRFQGKGLSKPLLEASLVAAREMGLQVKLEVHQTNLAAANLYRKYGFKPLGDYDVYIIRDLSALSGL